jgi:hypothetical protein
MMSGAMTTAAISSPCLTAAGLLCLLRPAAVQAYALKTSARWNPFFNWMKTPGYIWSLRICGAPALFMAALMVIGVVMNKS